MREPANKSESPRSLSPAPATTCRQAQQTAAKSTGSSNPDRRFHGSKDLLAEGGGFEPMIRFSIISCKPVNSLVNFERLKRPRT